MTPPAWYRSAGVAVLVVAAIACISSSAPAEDAPAAPGATPAAPAVPEAGGPLRVTLKNGCTVELAGLTNAVDKEAQWWAPDGTMLHDAKWRRDAYGARGGDFEAAYTALVRVTRPAGDTSGRFQTAAKQISIWGGAGTPEAGYTFVLSTLKKFGTADFSIAVAAGPWKPVRTIDRENDENSPDFKFTGVVLFAPLAERDGELMVSVTDNVADSEVQLRAFDVDGKEYAPNPVRNSSGVSNGTTGLRVTWGGFKLSRDRLGRVELQTRPLKYARFTGVSLRPGSTTAKPRGAAGALKDQPPAERRLYGDHWLQPDPLENVLRLIADAADVEIDVRWDELAKVGALRSSQVAVGVADPTVGEALERITRHFGEDKVRFEFVEEPNLHVKKFLILTSPPAGL